MKNKKSKKGFTLMEMLIVVAIIAILIAIAIPSFSSSLKKAKEAADEANLRSAYATATLDMMEKNSTGSAISETMQSADKVALTVQGLSSGSAITCQNGKQVKVEVGTDGYATYTFQ